MRHHDRGQASIEWIAVLGVVGAVLLAAAGGALPRADAIPRAVGGGFVRAFCLVGGGDCLGGAPRPCVVGARERSRERRAAFAVLRLADGRTVLREERSDGTVAVSVEDLARAGAELAAGGEVTLGGKGTKLGASLGVHGRGAGGRRFVLPDARTADALIARLAREGSGVERLLDGRGGPVPDEEWWAAGAGGQVEAGVEGLGLGAEAEALNSVVVGLRRRPRTGERTLVLRTDGELLAALTAPLAPTGAASPQRASLELAFDAAGRPRSLTLRGARGMGSELRAGKVDVHGGGLVEVEARLDLADPVVRAEARALIDALGDRRPGRVLAAGRALGTRLADGARIDVRVYATDRASRVRGATAGLLGKVGYEEVDVTRTARLVNAWGREPGMGWMRRLDCVGVA